MFPLAEKSSEQEETRLNLFSLPSLYKSPGLYKLHIEHAIILHTSLARFHFLPF
jgi:hypothetical protein